MRLRGMAVAVVAGVLGVTLPVAAQMMGMPGGAAGMMGMMGGSSPDGASGCPAHAADPAEFASNGPWIGFALAHAEELGLTERQVTRLRALRDDFRRQAAQPGADVAAIRAQIVQEASKLLGETQRAKLEDLARSMREQHDTMHQGGDMHQGGTGGMHGHMGQAPATRL